MDAAIERRLARRAERQLGLITTEQLRQEVGLTRRQIDRCQHQGRFVPVYREVMRIAGSVLTPQARILAATLATNAPASHRSAAFVHGTRDRIDTPEVLLAVGRSNRGGPIVHRTRTLSERDLTVVDGIPVTTMERTLIDLAAVVSPLVLRTTLERSLRLRKVDLDTLIQRFFQLAKRGRRGMPTLRALLCEHESGMAIAESDLEALLLHEIARWCLPTPSTQVEVCIAGSLYRIDVAYPELKIAIEGDGFGVHSMRNAFENDRVRQNRLVLAGWLVLRFTWRQLCYEEDLVIAKIADAIRQRTARR